MSAVLIDSNILVYAYDSRFEVKRARAIDTLAAVGSARLGCLSTQNLAEFFAVVRRGPSPMLTAEAASARVEIYMRTWRILDLTPAVIREALRGVREHRLSYWEAQLWASARLNRCETIFSEDFVHGSRVEGVRFANPLASDFRLGDWI